MSDESTPLIIREPVPRGDARLAAIAGRPMVCGVCGGRVKFVLSRDGEAVLRSLFCVADRRHFNLWNLPPHPRPSRDDFAEEVRAMVAAAAPPAEPAAPTRACPCCRTATFPAGEGSFDLCPVCFWEDDWVQAHDPRSHGGANRVSLDEARANYAAFGACEARFRGMV